MKRKRVSGERVVTIIMGAVTLLCVVGVVVAKYYINEYGGAAIEPISGAVVMNNGPDWPAGLLEVSVGLGFLCGLLFIVSLAIRSSDDVEEG